MLINIKSLTLRNFKGIKDLTINFGKVTDILGENASGKTTIFDGFTWLLFDKDSTDRKTFSIKTYDKTGEVINGLEHEVEGVLVIDGKEVVLKKTYKEQWTKKRGEAEKLLTGHTTEYFIDHVPVKKSEYTDKINSIIDEGIFKLVTNPLYFNNVLNWKDRRTMLLEIVGDIPDADIISSNKKLKDLERILGDKGIEDFRKMIASRKKKLNDEIKAIPIRIDEINNNIPEMTFDIQKLNEEAAAIQAEINEIENQLMDKSKVFERMSDNQHLLFRKKTELQNLEYRLKAEIKKPLEDLKRETADIEYKISSLTDSRKRLERAIKDDREGIPSLEQRIVDLRNQWHEENGKTIEFHEHDDTCPTCGQGLPAEQLDKKHAEMIDKFNQKKQYNLTAISSEGKKSKERLDSMTEAIKANEDKLSRILDEISTLEKMKASNEEKIASFSLADPTKDNPQYLNLLKEIENIESSMEKPDTQITDELKRDKLQKQIKLDEVKSKISLKDVIENSKKRVDELRAREKELANMIAEIEGQEYMCEEFIRTKVDLLETRINSKFEKVRFKLFNVLVNGALEECCETLVDGVPYSDANNAAKINAGIDIINTLSTHYKVSAPIFVDNRESVNKLIECISQLVNLIVSKDKNLKVEVA